MVWCGVEPVRGLSGRQTRAIVAVEFGMAHRQNSNGMLSPVIGTGVFGWGQIPVWIGRQWPDTMTVACGWAPVRKQSGSQRLTSWESAVGAPRQRICCSSEQTSVRSHAEDRNGAQLPIY